MDQRQIQTILTIGQANIKVDSHFDSGNLQHAIVQNDKLILTPALDPLNLQYFTKQSSKTFFHFKLTTNTHTSFTVIIKNMNILQYFSSQEQFEELYRICIAHKHGKGWCSSLTYQKVRPQKMKRVDVDGNYELHFEVVLKQEEQTYFAYHFPYSYEQSQQFLHKTIERVNNLNLHHNSNIYLKNQLLIQSLQGRAVNLLTLTQNSNQLSEQESRITKSIFPYYELEGRPHRFSKPYVLFTCRVHSGQTSSSYALEGIVNFLLSGDKTSQLLLKYFTFLIVPMINPDGVFHGTYRMDTLGHNLNRFYSTALSHKQPSIFAIQTLANHYSNRLMFFMDLHSHPHPNKGSFIYGNSHQQIQEQTESQLFAKILSFQSDSFGYQWSNYSNSQMNSRDANQLLTKDGSARVQLYKLLNIPFVFTMEMGYHGYSPKIVSQSNPFKGQHQRTDPIFSIEDYHQHGRSILMTLYLMFTLNCPQAQKLDEYKYLQQCREEICKELVQKEQRFRQMDGFVYKKIKIISEVIQEQFYQSFFKKYPFITSPIPDIDKHSRTLTPTNSIRKLQKIKKRSQSERKDPLRTLEVSPSTSQTKPPLIKSYKSTLDPQTKDISGLIQSIKLKQNNNYKFVKQLNLNFNPFPVTERKKIYNVLGSHRSSFKNNVMNQLQKNNQSLLTIDPQRHEAQFFKQQENDLIRHVKLHSFTPNNTGHCQDDSEMYNDGELQSHPLRQNSLILPRIPQRGSPTKQFKVEVKFQQQYQKKYHVGQINKSTRKICIIKPNFRTNSLKMRNANHSIK